MMPTIPDSDHYGIRADYRHNLVQSTFDATGDPQYWNGSRLENAAMFQYDVYATAASLIRKHRYRTLLDVGSGPPVKLKALMPGGLDICLVDQPNTAPLAKNILPKAQFLDANLESDFPLIDRKFDLVLCADVIEHLIAPDPCLDFMRRHLSTDGLLLISTPERDALRGRNCSCSPHPMHVREWNFDEFRRFLVSRNFEVLDHLLLPQQRTEPVRKAFGRLMAALRLPPSWYSCQLAICRVRE